MRKIIFILVFSLLIISCEKERPIIIENTDIPLINKVLSDGESVMEYTYNEANLLREEKGKLHYTRHNYNDLNQLTSSDIYMDPAMFSSSMAVIQEAMNRKEWVNPDNTKISLAKSFKYGDNGQVIRVIYERPATSNSEFTEFSFENDRITRQTMYWQNEISFYIDYLYDERGNLIKESKYHVSTNSSPELWTTTEYEFDNKGNPFRSFKRLVNPGKFTNPNNITKETYTIHFEVDQWIQRVSVINNSYEYNDNGYPVKVNGETEYVYE